MATHPSNLDARTVQPNPHQGWVHQKADAHGRNYHSFLLIQVAFQDPSPMFSPETRVEIVRNDYIKRETGQQTVGEPVLEEYLIMVPAVFDLYVGRPLVQLKKHFHPAKQEGGKDRAIDCTRLQRIGFLFSLLS